MTITNRPQWSLGRGNAVVPSRWQATGEVDGMPHPTTPTDRAGAGVGHPGNSPLGEGMLCSGITPRLLMPWAIPEPKPAGGSCL